MLTNPGKKIRFAGGSRSANRIFLRFRFRLNLRGLLFWLLAIAIWWPMACQGRGLSLPAAMPKWQYADLRALDPADAPTPGQDLVALSLRHEAEQIHIRLDWLDIGEAAECDVQIFLYAKDAAQPALSMILAANGEMRTSQALSGLRLYRDLFYDTWLVAFDIVDIKWLHAKYKIEIRSIDPQDGRLIDRIGPLASDAPPPAPVPILLAFWNTFPAGTPAQALRQWDGAHTGPLGNRHGLRHLLMAAQETGTAIFLLDLKTPANLSALDFAGGLAILQRLEKQGTVTLPDVVSFGNPQPAWINQDSAKRSRQAGLDFGLAASPLLYTPIVTNSVSAGYSTIFALQPEPSDPVPGSMQSCQTENYFLLKGSPIHPNQAAASFTPQAGADGPSLAVRQLLANPCPFDGYAQIGGDFTADTWGMPSAAQATLRYLAARPWLQVLDENDLLAWKTTQTNCPLTKDATLAPEQAELLAELAHAPANPLTQAAWQMYAALQTPATAQTLALRRAYIGQTGHLLAAARWAEQPQPMLDCSQDLDWDHVAECQLASGTTFAIIETQGGYVSVAATRLNGKIHQLIAPSWQFYSGLSDPMEWRLDYGVSADPGALPGAFYDPANKWKPYTAQAMAGKVVLSAEGYQKTFWLEDGDLVVEYEGDQRPNQAINLALDAWQRFEPWWWQRLGKSQSQAIDAWQTNTGIAVSLQAGSSTAETSCISFLDARASLQEPEDPNFAYPAGHYLPFPLTVCNAKNANNIRLHIEAWP